MSREVSRFCKTTEFCENAPRVDELTDGSSLMKLFELLKREKGDHVLVCMGINSANNTQNECPIIELLRKYVDLSYTREIQVPGMEGVFTEGELRRIWKLDV